MSDVLLGVFVGLAGWHALGMILETAMLGETHETTIVNVAISFLFMLFFGWTAVLIAVVA